MKRRVLFILLIVFLCMSFVKAETFVEGSFISGEYISKKKDGAIHYLTVQYLKDNRGNIVYCLEPYTKFQEGKSYTSYIGDISGYSGLSAEKKRKISLIVYYGYGYTGRTSSKWYAITQYLIWDTVTNSDGSIYFTDTLNGNKITKYSTEINQVLSDVNNHDTKPNFVKTYTVNYGEGLYIQNLSNKYYTVSNSTYKYTFNDTFRISDIEENGSFQVNKLSSFYGSNVAIFDSTNSQDLIRPGNVINPTYKINVNVLKGNIILDIKKDDDVYTVESDFSDTCYDVIKNTVVVDSVCTNEELTYQTVDLAYGEYEIVQRSSGIGYRKDNEVYRVVIGKDSQKPVVTLNNYLIRNTINILKKACKNDSCILEKDALFNVFDINGNLVNELVTDENGKASIVLGYGSYDIKQIKGMDGYSLSSDISERIVDEENEHNNEIFNRYIKKEEKPRIIETTTKQEVKEVKQEELEEVVPDTKVDGNIFLQIIDYIVQFFTSILDKIG